MTNEDRDGRAPWDTPEATAITDADSRADQADVTQQNLAPSSNTN